MLASISPVGEDTRSGHWGRTAAWFVAGSVLGGTATGAMLGAAGGALARVTGPWSTATTVALLLSTAILVVVADLARRVPTFRRQVNERWLDTYRAWVYGGGFGFQLGAGLLTTVTTAGTYLAFAAAMLTGSWRSGALVGLTYGLARALPLLAFRRVDSPRRLRSALRRVASVDRLARGLSIAWYVVAPALVLASSIGTAP